LQNRANYRTNESGIAAGQASVFGGQHESGQKDAVATQAKKELMDNFDLIPIKDFHRQIK